MIVDNWHAAQANFRQAYRAVQDTHLGPRPWGLVLWDESACSALLADMPDPGAVRSFLEHMPPDAPAVRRLHEELSRQTTDLIIRTGELRLARVQLDRFRQALDSP